MTPLHVATSGESQLSYLLPGVQDAISRLRDDARRGGVETYIRDFGGARTPGIVAQLIEWRDQAVATGEPFYRVSPFATGKHARGAACDLGVASHPPSMTTADAYRWLGSLCGTHGLRWGGEFRPSPDVFHFESQQSLAALDARWAAWIVDPSFPNAPERGADALGALDWQVYTVVITLLIIAVVYSSTHTRNQ